MTDLTDIIKFDELTPKPAETPLRRITDIVKPDPIVGGLKSWAHINALDLFSASADRYLKRWQETQRLDDLKLTIHYLQNIVELHESK